MLCPYPEEARLRRIPNQYQASLIRCLKPCLVESGTEFYDALARGFYRGGEICGGGFVEEKNYALEFAFAGAAGEGQANGLKEFAAANVQMGFHFVNENAKGVAGKRRGIKKQRGQLAKSVACRIAGECGVGVGLRENFLRVVVKNKI